MSDAAPAKARRTKKIRHFFATPDGTVLEAMNKAVEKRSRDILTYHHGSELHEGVGQVTFIDPQRPLGNKVLQPGLQSPLCTQCGMDKLDPDSPYIAFRGSENPLVTILVDGISRKEDVAGEIAAAGYTSGLYEMVEKIVSETDVDPERDVRWLSVTRCANRHSKQVNLSTKANWCRYHVVQDLMLHPPRLIIPVGTVALGSLSHKSNAFDWQGKILTYRGWPDDWLTNPKFMLPRMSPFNVEEMVVGHPVFGPPPSHDFRIPIYPIQSPKLIYFQNNKSVTTKWKRVFMEGIKLATQDIKALNYHRAWYRVVTTRDEVIEGLKFLINNPGLMVSFDTETTGLKQFAKGQKIVFIMFRWKHPKTGEPMSLGFPWDYPESDLYPHIADLTPWVLEALYASRLCGHNLVFDLLFCAATLKGCDINRLAVNADYDTWHMAYTARQQRGALGLERIAYDYVPDLAGYEEEMTLLIDLFKELLHPGADKGGHYARCPKEYWNSHLVPYVMGDVEVCYQSRDKLEELLRSRNVYPFPLAHPTQRGYFTTFTPPSRHWVYENIMAPANKLLTKMMARGMFVNVASVRRFEAAYPARIKELTDAFASTKKPNIADWIKQKETMIREKGDNKVWEFDLENKEVLKDLLFGFLELPIQRLTKAGKKLFGDRPEDLTNVSREELYPFAAVDKFTLNKLCADHEELRPLLDYRKAYKVYTTYVRPLRNCFDPDIDKKRRDEIPHLWIRKEDRPIYKDEIFSADDCGGDSCIHASFMQTGTRGGRLSCRDPNLQQLPSDSDIKEMFVSRFGPRGCIYAGDLSQIELRLLAAACGDQNMMRAYFENLDLHTLTTSRIFKLPYETFSKEHMEGLQKAGKGDEAKKLELKRRIGKTCNFLTGYGGGAFGLQTTLANSKIYLSLEECESILESFFSSYPALKEYLGIYKSFILRTGCAVSLLGRVRFFEEIGSEDREAVSKALRAGCNHLIQATASDMMLICLVVIEDLMRKANLESMLVSTVHDSLAIDAVRTELPQIHDIVYSVLNNIPEVLQLVFGPDYDTSWMIVPFAGDCEVGVDYLHLNKIPTKGAIDWDSLLKTDE